MAQSSMPEGKFTVTKNKFFIIAAVLYLFSAIIDMIDVYRMMFGLDKSEDFYDFFTDFILDEVVELPVFLVLAFSLMTREGWILRIGALSVCALSRFLDMTMVWLHDSTVEAKMRLTLIFLTYATAILVYICSIFFREREIRIALKCIWIIPYLLMLSATVIHHHFNVTDPFKYYHFGDYAEDIALFLFMFGAVMKWPEIKPVIPKWLHNILKPMRVIPADNSVKAIETPENVEESGIGTVLQTEPAKPEPAKVDLAKAEPVKVDLTK